MPKDGLTKRQWLFVNGILAGKSHFDAAKDAGFSAKSAQAQASQLLAIPKVSAAINEALRRRSDRVEVKADDILRELSRIGLSDFTEAFDEAGMLKPIKDLPLDVRRAISAVEVEDIFAGAGANRQRIGVLTKVKFWDKTKGLELLGKNLKLFTDVVEHRGLDGLAERIRNGRQRVASR